MGRILYLDDDVPLAELLRQRLARLGHLMDAYSDVTHALREFARNPQAFDLVLTDMSMPGSSGLDFAREILTLRPDARVIIASGCEDPNWADFALSVGVNAVLLKPFQASEFADVICRLIGP